MDSLEGHIFLKWHQKQLSIFSSEMCFAQNPRERRHERWMPVLVSQTMGSVFASLLAFQVWVCRAFGNCVLLLCLLSEFGYAGHFETVNL